MRRHFKIIESNLARFVFQPISSKESNFCKNYLTIDLENWFNVNRFPADL